MERHELDARISASSTRRAGASFSPSSFAGGVIGGGNLQMGNWMFGLEASFLGMGLNETVVQPLLSGATPSRPRSTGC